VLPAIGPTLPTRTAVLAIQMTEPRLIRSSAPTARLRGHIRHPRKRNRGLIQRRRAQVRHLRRRGRTHRLPAILPRPAIRRVAAVVRTAVAVRTEAEAAATAAAPPTAADRWHSLAI
jgi:hypothetical protein